MIVLFGMIIKHKSLKRKINVTFDFCCEISKTCKIRKTCEEQYQGNESLSFRLGRVIHHSSGSLWCVFFFKRGWEKEKDRVRERSYLFFTVKLNFFTKCWFSLSKFVNNIRVSFGSKLQWSIQTKYYIGAPGWSSGLMRQFLDQRGRGSGPGFESACQHFFVFKNLRVRLWDKRISDRCHRKSGSHSRAV